MSGNGYAAAMKRLIDELKGMPGVGAKSAERIAFYFLTQPREKSQALAETLIHAKESLRFCPVCFNITDQDMCDICTDTGRDRTLLCVVEQPKDIIAIEKTGSYHGLYHVLLGVLSPLEGVTPADLKIDELIRRLSAVPERTVAEVIIATSFDTEGEATALYVTRVLKPLGIGLSRISHGIPFGSKIEYADRATVVRAMALRNAL